MTGGPLKTLRLPLVGDTGLPVVPLVYLLVLPLAASLILGAMFSAHQISRVPTVIMDSDNSSLSRTLVRTLTSNDVFDVKGYPTLETDIEDLFARGEIAAALIIPRGFSSDLVKGKAPRVLVVYDGTQMSQAGAAKSRITEVLTTAKTAYLLQVLEGKLGVMPAGAGAALAPMGYTTRYIGNPTKNTPNSMLEGILFNMAQIAMAMVGVEVVTNTRRYRHLRLKGLIATALGCLAVLLIFVTQVLLFEVPFRGTLDAAVLLTVPFVLTMTNLGTFFRLLTDSRSLAIKASGILSVTMVLAGYTFPVFAMPEGFHLIEPWLPFYHFAVPIRDISLVGRTTADVLPHILWLVDFAALFQTLNFLLFRRRRRQQEETP